MRGGAADVVQYSGPSGPRHVASWHRTPSRPLPEAARLTTDTAVREPFSRIRGLCPESPIAAQSALSPVKYVDANRDGSGPASAAKRSCVPGPRRDVLPESCRIRIGFCFGGASLRHARAWFIRRALARVERRVPGRCGGLYGRMARSTRATSPPWWRHLLLRWSHAAVWLALTLSCLIRRW